MTLRYADGFDYVPAGLIEAERARILAAAGWFFEPSGFFPVPADVRTGRFGFGKALGYANFVTNVSAGMSYVRPVLTETAEGYLGVAIYRGSAMSSTASPWISLYDAVSDAHQVSARFDANGVVRVFRGHPSEGVQIGRSDSGVFREDTWFYAELGGLTDPAAGTTEVRINATDSVVNLIGQNTQATAETFHDAIALGYVNDSNDQMDCAFDDIYFNDADGVVNNGFLGNIRVKTQFAAGAGAVDDFAAVGAATTWQAMLNTLLDDSKYAWSPNVGDKILVALQAIMGAAPVHGTQVRIGVRQTDSTQRTIRPLLALGGVEGANGDRALNQLFTFLESVIELSPDTGIGMAGAELNAGEAGLEIIA